MGLCVRWVRGLAVSLAVLGGLLVSAGVVTVASSGVAIAQTVNSIVVEGNRRVEAATIRSYFKAGPGGQLGPARNRRRHQGALRHRTVFRRPHQPCRRPAGRHRRRKSGDQPRRLRGQQEGQGRPARNRSAIEGARHAVEADRAGRRSAHHRNLPPHRLLRRHRGAEDHRIAEQPRRSGVRDQRRQQDGREGNPLCRRRTPSRPVASSA